MSAFSSDPESSIAGATVFDAEPRRSEVPELGRSVEACASTSCDRILHARDRCRHGQRVSRNRCRRRHGRRRGRHRRQRLPRPTRQPASGSPRPKATSEPPNSGTASRESRTPSPPTRSTRAAASAPTTALLDLESQLAEPRSGATTSRAAHQSRHQRLTVAVPMSSQLPPMSPSVPARPRKHHETLVVVPNSSPLAARRAWCYDQRTVHFSSRRLCILGAWQRRP